MLCPQSLIYRHSAKETRRIEFACGDVQSIDKKNKSTKEENGTQITYVPDDSMFKKYRYRNEYVERMLRYYTYLNRGWLFVTMVNGFVPRMGSRIYSRKIFPKLPLSHYPYRGE